MLYLIMSSAMKEDENGGKEYFDILKIGYTEDKNKDRRFEQYYLHNPTCKVLKTIPNATQEQESRVQYKFKDLLYTRNEWFKYDQSIIDFFNDIRSLEELDKLPKNPIRGDKEILEKKILAKKILEYVIVSNNKIYKDIKKEIEDYINSMMIVLGDKIDEESIIDYLRNDNSIDNSRIDYYLECKKKDLTKCYTEDSKINNEVINFFRIYSSKTTMYDKLRLLCEYDLSDSARDIIIGQIPDNDEIKSYYTTIGPDRLHELGYSITKIKKELNIITFNPILLINEIYKEFKINDKLSLADIKNKLAAIYSKINYKKSPKAVDLLDFFDLSECYLNVIVDGKVKRARGYQIISSYESEIRNKISTI